MFWILSRNECVIKHNTAILHISFFFCLQQLLNTKPTVITVTAFLLISNPFYVILSFIEKRRHKREGRINWEKGKEFAYFMEVFLSLIVWLAGKISFRFVLDLLTYELTNNEKSVNMLKNTNIDSIQNTLIIKKILINTRR